MKGKKVLKIIGIILLILLVVFLIHAIKNFIIVSNLQSKISEYTDSSNYHIHMVAEESSGIKITTDYYKKDNKEAVFLQRDKDEEITKVSFYNNGERTDVFTETPTEKTANIDTKSTLASIQIINALQADNKWQTFIYSALCRIKSTDYNGKDCYVVENYLSPYYLSSYDNSKTAYIIEKETGLLVKSEAGETITEREHEFDNVDDSIFSEPDISKYTIKKSE